MKYEYEITLDTDLGFIEIFTVEAETDDEACERAIKQCNEKYKEQYKQRYCDAMAKYRRNYKFCRY
jgi:hypothetical protein